MNKTKLLPLFALMLVMGAFLIAGTTAYASDGGNPAEPVLEAEALSVDDVWLTGDIIHIAVTDKDTGVNQTLELNLRDYAGVTDEYVTIQAIDRTGKISNSIQFKNPFYTATVNTPQTGGDTTSESESAVPDDAKSTDGSRPFTPDGTGTVVDNVTDGDSKEFFSIETEDGNIFYLIVDRQRDTDNVYLLNAVTEYDLASLAKPGDGRNISAVPEAPTVAPTPEPTAPVEPTPAPPEKSGNNSTLIFVVIAVVVVGGVGYYLKIVRPKQNGGDYDDGEGFDEDTEVDVENDGEVDVENDGEGEDE